MMKKRNPLTYMMMKSHNWKFINMPQRHTSIYYCNCRHVRLTIPFTVNCAPTPFIAEVMTSCKINEWKQEILIGSTYNVQLCLTYTRMSPCCVDTTNILLKASESYFWFGKLKSLGGGGANKIFAESKCSYNKRLSILLVAHEVFCTQLKQLS